MEPASVSAPPVPFHDTEHDEPTGGRMPLTEKALTKTYKGRAVDLAALRSNEDWSDQGSAKPRRRLPAKKDLWALSMQPLHPCCDHSFELVVFIHLNASGAVGRIETAVYRSYSPTALEEIRVPFFDHDLRRAIDALEAVVLPAPAAPKAPPRKTRRAHSERKEEA